MMITLVCMEVMNINSIFSIFTKCIYLFGMFMCNFVLTSLLIYLCIQTGSPTFHMDKCFSSVPRRRIWTVLMEALIL